MIVCRAPLRITLGGGGTDVRSHYEDHGGYCIAAAIDRYVYVTLHETFVEDLIVKYSRLERVSDGSRVQHPIVRECLALLGIPGSGLEITSMADIHSGTGLGSSASFTCALLKTLHAWQRDLVEPRALAEEACGIEIDALHRPVGKQDQYIAALGGVLAMTFSPDGVHAAPLVMPVDTLYTLEENLLLFYTGHARDAADVLSSPPAQNNLAQVEDVGREASYALEAGDLHGFAKLLTKQWELKRARQGELPDITSALHTGLNNGALGGKLVGAGGGGVLMFYAADKATLRHAMRRLNLREVRFRFDFDGTKVVAS